MGDLGLGQDSGYPGAIDTNPSAETTADETVRLSAQGAIKGAIAGQQTLGVFPAQNKDTVKEYLQVHHSVYGLTNFPTAYSFGRINIPASLTNANLYPNPANSGITRVPTPIIGSLTGISISCSAQLSGGSLTILPFINGVQKTPILTLSSGDQYEYEIGVVGAVVFAGGGSGYLEVKFTTDGSFAPTTMDIIVHAFVSFQNAL